MTIELWTLVVMGLWCLSLTGPLTLGRMMTPGGLQWGTGNRETPFTFPAWVERAKRAHANSVENLAPFACLIVALHLSGTSSALSEAAACAFVAARILHSLCYLAGLVPWRTLMHIIGLIAQVLLFVALLS